MVPPQDLQSCSDGEAHQRKEGILKSNAIDVVCARPADQIPGDIVAPEKHVENGRIGLRGRRNFPGRSSLATRRRLDISADEPSAEPSGGDVLHWRWRSIGQRLRYRRQIDFVRHLEVMQALANAPDVFCRLPIELFRGQATRENGGPPAGGIQLVDQAYRPGGQLGISSQSHGSAYSVHGVDGRPNRAFGSFGQ